MENSGIDLRLNEFSDATRSTSDRNKEFYCIFEALRTNVKKLETQIKEKDMKQQDDIIELKRQMNNLELKVL